MASNKKDEKVKISSILNVKFPESDYEKLKKIAEELGNMSLSSLIRMVIYNHLKQYEKSGNAQDFIKMK